MAKSRLLYPPFVWISQKEGLQQDRNRSRWSKTTRRQMRHGTFNWDQSPQGPTRKDR